jgi:DNA-binding MurR/RpiR family transcriptional regulator
MTDPGQEQESHERNKQLSSPGKRYSARLQQRSLAGILQQRVIDKERQSLNAALDRVRDDGSAIALAATIVAARRRFVAGSGKSFAYATLLARDLSVGLSQVFLIDDTVNRMVDILSETKTTDVLIAFSMRRYRRDTIALCKSFVAAGGTVVAITDEADSPVTSLASAVIYVPTDSASYTDSPTAITAITHLVATLATASAKGARRRLAERDRLSDEFDLYLEP